MTTKELLVLSAGDGCWLWVEPQWGSWGRGKTPGEAARWSAQCGGKGVRGKQEAILYRCSDGEAEVDGLGRVVARRGSTVEKVQIPK